MDIDKTNSPEIQNPCNAPSDKAIAQALPNEFDFEQWYVENAFDYERNPIGSNECLIARKAWHAALRAREIDAAEPQGDGKGALYHATNRLMQVIGEDGEVDSRHAAVTAVMDALKAIDGGQYQAQAERAEDVASDINLSTLRFLDGGVVQMDISDYRRLAAEQGKDRKDATPKLIGWRTDDYLMETSDPAVARNWQGHHRMLPIFQGDPNTKLDAAMAQETGR